MAGRIEGEPLSPRGSELEIVKSGLLEQLITCGNGLLQAVRTRPDFCGKTTCKFTTEESVIMYRFDADDWRIQATSRDENNSSLVWWGRTTGERKWAFTGKQGRPDWKRDFIASTSTPGKSYLELRITPELWKIEQSEREQAGPHGKTSCQLELGERSNANICLISDGVKVDGAYQQTAPEDPLLTLTSLDLESKMETARRLPAEPKEELVGDILSAYDIKRQTIARLLETLPPNFNLISFLTKSVNSIVTKTDEAIEALKQPIPLTS